ncbi:MAG TPA: hypothetical protein PK760_09030 [Flavobacteriales bacterium]|nr:hypothetical protein [Flavobacteriales bacterium]
MYAQQRSIKAYEKAGTRRISVQDPAMVGQVVKNILAAKEAMERVAVVRA